MRKENLIPVIAKHDPILANAVSRMVDYIQDRWAAPYPSKEQTEAVNAYLRSTQKITISAIRVLDHDQLDRLQDVLNHIAADREYYMPEQRQCMGR